MTLTVGEDKVNARVYAPDIQRELLHESAKNNDVQEIKRLLSLGADVNAKGKFNLTALQVAAEENRGNSHLGAIEVLLKNGADVNVKVSTYYDCTPLYCLARDADVEVVQLLLDYKADVNSKTDAGGIPLREAIIGGKLEVVQLLLEHGSDVRNIEIDKTTPLHLVACCNSFNNRFKIAEVLLKKGADVNAQDNEKMTPLHYLTGDGDLEGIQLFLNFGANYNLFDEDDKIPLFYAISDNNEEVAQLLLDLGSDIDTFSARNGSTLLHTACEHGCSLEIIKKLLQKNLDVNALNYKGQTPLMVLFFQLDLVTSDSATLTFLLKYADLNTVDSSGKNILSFVDREFTWKIILKHMAKLQALDINFHPSILESMSKNKEQKSYFEKCTKELTEAKGTKSQECWVNFFNLLVDSKRKLKNYAGNKDLVKQFENSECKKKFPIYGALMETKIAKGIRMRKFFDDSAEILSDLIPFFNPTHLIIRDLLDFLKSNELLKLCEKY